MSIKSKKVLDPPGYASELDWFSARITVSENPIRCSKFLKNVYYHWIQNCIKTTLIWTKSYSRDTYKNILPKSVSHKNFIFSSFPKEPQFRGLHTKKRIKCLSFIYYEDLLKIVMQWRMSLSEDGPTHNNMWI